MRIDRTCRDASIAALAWFLDNGLSDRYNEIFTDMVLTAPFYLTVRNSLEGSLAEQQGLMA